MGKSYLLAVGVLFSVAAAHAATYTVTTLTSVSSNTTDSYSGAQAYGVSATTVSGLIADDASSGNLHAALWDRATGQLLDIDNGHTQTSIVGASSSAQVGSITTAGVDHASVWSGTAGSQFSLSDIGFTGSAATGVATITGTHYITGFGFVPSSANTNALLWTGSGATYTMTNLHPSDPTYVSSFARSTDGTTVVGAVADASQVQQAALWNISGPTATFALLAGSFDSSVAWGVSGDQIVGSGDTPTGTHAMLWTNGGTVVIDLQDPSLTDFSSFATATNGINQVGEVTDADGNSKPYIWTGSAASGIALPVPFASNEGEAFGIDAAGDIVGYAVDMNGVSHAMLWTPDAAPEPASVATLLLGAAMLVRRRK